MHEKVHPAIVALVIALTCAAVALYAWGNGRAAELGGPAQLLTDPAGHLYLQMQSRLLEYDPDGRFLRSHDLADLGAGTLIGGVAFFGNGDLLLRRGADPRSMWDRLRAFGRAENRSSLEPAAPESGLYRCQLATAACDVFGDPAIDPQAAFSVFIDAARDDVYLSDTSRHLLRRYSADGRPRAPPAGGFRFPNQLALIDGRLYVADTNNHRIAVVEPGPEAFGSVLDAIDAVPPEAAASGRRWPSHFARVGETWWVNVMDAAMEYGGIYVFDADWRYLRRASLPDGADPIAVLPFGGEVLVSDWFNDAVYRLAPDGSLRGEFTSDAFEALVVESRQQRLMFRLFAYSGAALLALVFVVLALRAMLDRGGAGRHRAAFAAPAPDVRREPHWIYPDRTLLATRLRRLLLAGVALVVALPLASLLLLRRFGSDGLEPLIGPAVGVFAAAVVVAFMLHAMLGALGRTAVCLHGDTLVLRDLRGRETRAAIRDVLFNRSMIATPDAAVFLGNPSLPLYAPETLEEELFPYLDAAEQVSEWRMQRHLLAIRQPQGLAAAFVFGALLVAALVVIGARLLPA